MPPFVILKMGMKNHDLVPVELIASIAKLRHGGTHKILSTLLTFKLIAHDRSVYDGAWFLSKVDVVQRSSHHSGISVCPIVTVDTTAPANRGQRFLLSKF